MACSLLAAHVPCQARKPGKDRRRWGGERTEAYKGRSRSTHSSCHHACLEMLTNYNSGLVSGCVFLESWVKGKALFI